MHRAKGKSRLRSPTVRWEHSRPGKLRDFHEEFLPTRLGPAAFVQGWENIDHSAHDSFEVGLVEEERHRMGIKIHEGAPWERT